MKGYQWQNRIGTATLAFSLLFGAAIILSSTAQAQYPNDRDAQQRRDRDNRDRDNRDRNNGNRNATAATGTGTPTTADHFSFARRH